MAARLKKNKPRVEHEPRSAHGRAVNNKILSSFGIPKRHHLSPTLSLLGILKVLASFGFAQPALFFRGPFFHT